MAEGETESPRPKKCGPYISSVTSQSVNVVIRGVVLFFIGVFLALVLNLLQIQRNVTLFPPDVITSIFSSAWWVPPCCGTASAVIGLLYPCIDRHLGEPHKFKREWSSVMRCVAVFVGINHASAVSFLKHAVTRQPTTSLPSTLMVSLSLNVGPVAETPG